MPRYPTVLLDLDGTIRDSIRLIVDSYHHTMRMHGLPAQDDRVWLEGIGTPLRTQLGPFATEASPMDALVATYRDFNIANHDQAVTAYPGVVDVLHTLSGLGHRLALVTSKNHVGARRGLRLAGIEPLFPVIVSADDVTRPKPDGEPVRRALELLGTTAAGSVFVGDSRHDIQAGRAAGVSTAAVLWGPFRRADLEADRPDHWLERPEAILAITG
jgi:pyrophosphatase PpaX